LFRETQPTAEKTLLRQRLFLRFALMSFYAAGPTVHATDRHVAILAVLTIIKKAAGAGSPDAPFQQVPSQIGTPGKS
jgi:hypothetical protein